MQKISLRKQLSVIRLYLGGLSYDNIAAKTGVSKGTVANVLADLKSSRILDIQGPAEQLELLRELATDLQRLQLTPDKAIVGLAVVSHLQELAIEPADIQDWAVVYRGLAASEANREAFLKTALHLHKLRQDTGLTVEELEVKAQSLGQEVAKLEPIANELQECQQQLPDLKDQKQTIEHEISKLEKQYKNLQSEITQKEKREVELSRRVGKLEQRAQEADERLASARTDLKQLASLGLSLDDLPGLVHRLSAIAQKHYINPTDLRNRLLAELETIDASVGLESRQKEKEYELDNIKQDIKKAHQEYKAEEQALKRLRQQQANLHASIAQDHAHLRDEMQATTRIAAEANANLRHDLEKTMHESILEVENLRDQALKLGEDLGRFTTIVETNQWLQIMAYLIKGNAGITTEDLRTVALPVLRGLKHWMQQNPIRYPQLYLLTQQLDNIIGEIEKWKD